MKKKRFSVEQIVGVLKQAEVGVPVAVAQAQLGHAAPRITLSIYTQVLPGAQRDAVERLERHLFPNVPKLHQYGASGPVVQHG